MLSIFFCKYDYVILLKDFNGFNFDEDKVETFFSVVDLFWVNYDNLTFVKVFNGFNFDEEKVETIRVGLSSCYPHFFCKYDYVTFVKATS
jgi:hypothetical protein